MDIIHAARTGNYMHGNGAQWYIINTFGKKVCIDTTTRDAFAVEVPNYTGAAYTCHVTADNLERFLMASNGDIYTTEMDYYTAKNIVRDHIINGDLVFTNGGQWYINSFGTIKCFELGVAGRAVVSNYDGLASWKYTRATHNAKAVVTDSIKEYFNIR
jgi:hypothetical protein